MRRLLRILFKVTATASLVACAAAIGLWVRSYWVSDHVNLNRIVRKFALAEMREAGFLYHSTEVYASRGHIVAYWSEFDGDVIDEGWQYESRPPDVIEPRGTSVWARLGFETYDASGGGVATAPIWPIVLAAGLLPCAYLISLGGRRRALRRGLCPACGYDLRATPDRCPECGMVPRAAEGNEGLGASIARPKPLLRIAVLALTLALGALGLYTWWAGVGDRRTLSVLCLGVVLGLLYTVRGGSLPSVVYRLGGTAITADGDRRNLPPKLYLPILLGVIAVAVVVYYFFGPGR